MARIHIEGKDLITTMVILFNIACALQIGTYTLVLFKVNLVLFSECMLTDWIDLWSGTHMIQHQHILRDKMSLYRLPWEKSVSGNQGTTCHRNSTQQINHSYTTGHVINKCHFMCLVLKHNTPLSQSTFVWFQFINLLSGHNGYCSLKI